MLAVKLSVIVRNDLSIKIPHAASLGAIVLILFMAFGLMTSSALRKSATVDEQSHLFRGAAYLEEGATHFLLGHPLLGSMISALPLLTESDLRLPVTDLAWETGNWSLAGDAFLWRVNDNPQRLIFLGRLPVIWLTLLLGALVLRWGRELAGPAVGVWALALFLWDPNVLAHGRLITGDLPVALFFTLAVYGYWRWVDGRSSPAVNIFLTGLGLGLAGATKFNAALLLPILGIVGVVLAWRRRDWRPLTALAAAGLIGWAVIWVVYGLAIRPLPGGAFWDDLFWELQYFGKSHGAYLAGQISTDGWWYYFPLAFLIKTSLPTLMLLFWALIRLRTRGNRRQDLLFLLWPPAVYFAISMTSSLNIGYRYLLPMLPFLYVWTAVILQNLLSTARRASIPLAMMGMLLLTSLLNWPDYIPYFNIFVRENGWRILSDSNVDWGQDLPALADWQQMHGGEPVKLSYFGTAHPSAYDVDFDPLPTWLPGPEQNDPALQPFFPEDPAPGLYAISVTNLHGVVLGTERDTFAWFREREPLARVGGSLFIYEVAARGPATALTLSQLRPAQLAPDLYERLGTNDVRIRWFDAATSFVWPSGGGWMAVPAGLEPHPGLAVFWPSVAEGTAVSDNQTETLYHLPPAPEFDWLGPETELNGLVTFLGYERLGTKLGKVVLMTAWHVEKETERPLKIFVHVLDADGELLGQWDGLDVESLSWQPSDTFVQMHQFQIADDTLPFALSIGIYDAISLERLGEPVFISLFSPENS